MADYLDQITEIATDFRDDYLNSAFDTVDEIAVSIRDTAAEITDGIPYLEDIFDSNSDGMVGVYFEVGGAISIPVPWLAWLGVGAEGVYYIGVDNSSGEVVHAFYKGVIATAGVGGFAGAGVFHFDGEAADLVGWSVGAQGGILGPFDAGVTVTLPADGPSHRMTYVGAGIGKIVGNVAVGETTSIRSGHVGSTTWGELPVSSGQDGGFPGIPSGSESIVEEGLRNGETVTIESGIEGTDFILKQTIIPSDVPIPIERPTPPLHIESTIVDQYGNPVSAAESEAFLLGLGAVYETTLEGEPSKTVAIMAYLPSDVPDAYELDFSERYERVETCFLAGTLIDMWPVNSSIVPNTEGLYDETAVLSDVWQKAIEDIIVDDLVVSFDEQGNLKPGRVTQTKTNTVSIILDFFGTGVTPGHVYYRADSLKESKFETLIDILRDDGVIEKSDGTKVRAATGVPLDDIRDAFVWAISGDKSTDGAVIVKESAKLRLGTQFIMADGKTLCIADLIATGGGEVGRDGLIYTGEGGNGMPFHWAFSDTLPKPEDYILKRSGTTLEEIYKVAEWDEQRPYMPAPVLLDGTSIQPSTRRESIRRVSNSRDVQLSKPDKIH